MTFLTSIFSKDNRRRKAYVSPYQKIINVFKQRVENDGGTYLDNGSDLAAIKPYDKDVIDVITPSTIKAGKTYGIYGNDGTVDRNSEATYIDESGVLQTVQPNELRIDWSSGNPKILVEAEATNLLANSNDFSTWGFVSNAVGSHTANYGISPDGTQNADRINYTVTNSGDRFQESTNISGATAGRVYVFSFWLKKLAGHTLTDFNIRLTGNGGASESETSIVSVIATDEWRRVSVSRTIIENDRTSLNSVVNNISGTGTMDILIYESQLELIEMTSNIFTNGSIATRLEDTVLLDVPTGATVIRFYNDGEFTEEAITGATHPVPVGSYDKIEFR